MPISYPVDYVGNLVSNKVNAEPHALSAANFRNYKVIIPQFAPFHITGVIVRHPQSNYTLIKDQDYILTHLYVEASKSLGHDVYGSISITSGLTGIFTVTYQTIGGDWTLPANTIATILANMTASPRTTYWTQVALYPIVFPPIVHDTSVEDLTRMSHVVTALNQIRDALEEGGEGSTPIIPYASSAEARAGKITNEVINPLTAHAAITQRIMDENSDSRNFKRDYFGKAGFFNDGFKVINRSGQYIVNAGSGYVDGLPQKNLLSAIIESGPLPADVWLESSYQSTLGTVQQRFFTDTAKLIENRVVGSNPFFYTGVTSQWRTMANSSTTAANMIASYWYYDKVLKTGFSKISLPDTNAFLASYKTYSDTSATKVLATNKPYVFSFYAKVISGSAMLNIRIANPSDSVTPTPVNHFITLTETATRYAIHVTLPTAATEIMFRSDTGIEFLLGGMQIEDADISLLTSATAPAQIAGTATVVLATSLATTTSQGPWSAGPYASKLGETTANSKHIFTRHKNTTPCIPGVRYNASFMAKAVERNILDVGIFFTGHHDSGINTSLDYIRINLTTGVLLHSNSNMRNVTINNVTADVAGYKLIEFSFYAPVEATPKFSFKLINGTESYAGTTGSGVLMTDLVFAHVVTPKINLLRDTDALHSAFWDRTNLIVDRKRLANFQLEPSAFKINPNIVNGQHVLSQTAYVSTAGTYSFTVSVKASEYRRLSITLATSSGNLKGTTDLTSASNPTTTIAGTGWTFPVCTRETAVNGWIRVRLTGTVAGSFTQIVASVTVLNNSGNLTYIGDGKAGLQIERPQLELANAPTAYQEITAPKPSELLVSNRYTPASYLINARSDWYDANDDLHTFVKLATIEKDGNVIDHRNVVNSDGSLASTFGLGVITYVPEMMLESGKRYWVGNGETIHLPPLEYTKDGDVFYFEKPLKAALTLSTQRLNNVFIRENVDNAQNGAVINTAKSVTINDMDRLSVVCRGTRYEVLHVLNSGGGSWIALAASVTGNEEVINDIIQAGILDDAAAIRRQLQADVYQIETLTGTAESLVTSGANQKPLYIRMTNAAEKTLTVRPNSTYAIAPGTAVSVRNVGAGDLIITPGASVVINAPNGGTLTVPVNGTVTLLCVAINQYDLLGQVLLD